MSASRNERSERKGRGDLARVLVVDDEADIRELLDLTLARMGLAVDCAATVAEASQWLERQSYQLCLTDMRLPDGDGLAVVQAVARLQPQAPVAVITAYGSTENAVAALKAGAFDYLAKPLALEQLRSLVKSVLNLPGEKNVDGVAAPLLGGSSVMAAVREMIVKLARSQAPVYISGESGSGKERAARLIHQQSARHAAPFVAVNCGAIPENLMESEFFGHRKGAFTGADSDHVGLFQAASGGTLFLDEVADLPLAMQVKLLRAIQEKRVRRIGSASEESVDVRILSATHHDLKAGVEAGSFRQDLYYRLNVIELKMPPLRERGEDVLELAGAMLQRMLGHPPPQFSPAALQALKHYSFPGNVRELENILERAVALSSGGEIGIDDLQLGEAPAYGALSDASSAAEVPANSGRNERNGLPLDRYLNQVERQAILAALEEADGNRTAAARLLGISFRSLRYRIERLGIE